MSLNASFGGPPRDQAFQNLNVNDTLTAKRMVIRHLIANLIDASEIRINGVPLVPNGGGGGGNDQKIVGPTDSIVTLSSTGELQSSGSTLTPLGILNLTTTGGQLQINGSIVLQENTAQTSLAVGSGASFGNNADLKNTSLGVDAAASLTSGGNNVALGYGVVIPGASNTNLVAGSGASTTALSSRNVILGGNARTTSNGSQNTIAGYSATVTNTGVGDCVAMGANASADTSNNATAIGSGTTIVNSAGAVAVGFAAGTTSAPGAIAIGDNAKSNGNGNVVVGASSTGDAAGTFTTTVGATSSNFTSNGIVVGSGSTLGAGCTNSVIVGAGSSIADGSRGVILGSGSQIMSGVNGVIVLGAGVVADTSNAINSRLTVNAGDAFPANYAGYLIYRDTVSGTSYRIPLLPI